MNKIFDQKYHLYYILGIAVIVRVFFSFGHVFSDDAYFDYLSYTLFKFDYAKDYIGYPHTPLRINLIALTAISFWFFGTNEFATVVFPMIFSVGNVLLAYFFTRFVTKNETTSLIAALLMAFFPTDVAFATINFSDSPAAFFINLGLYFLYKSHHEKSIKYSVFAGLSFFLSIQFKVNIFFIGLLLGLLWLYLSYKSKSINWYIPVALSFVGLNLVLEGLIYLKLHGEFLYRFHQIELNSVYNRNEFFLLGSRLGYATEADFWPEVFNRVFILNVKDVFLRRFYLFLPLVALFQSYRFIKKKEYTWLAYWFLGLSLLFIGFTSSFVRYQPIILRLNWYMFPLFLPEVMLSAILLSAFSTKIRTGLIVVFLAGSLVMTNAYTSYFNVNEYSAFKSFLRANPEKIIYTDHFTKYSIDLIDSYKEPLRTHRILGENIKLEDIESGDWIVYKIEHINELKEQGHTYPDFNILISQTFKKVFESGGFQVYEKTR